MAPPAYFTARRQRLVSLRGACRSCRWRLHSWHIAALALIKQKITLLCRLLHYTFASTNSGMATTVK
jgi:hypothetical protein